MRFKAIIFDFIGTTVLEKDPNLINNCFASAFSDHQVFIDRSVIRNSRGRDKRNIIADLLDQYHLPAALSKPIYQSFTTRLKSQLTNFEENAGATDIFNYLKAEGVVIGLGSGLPRDIFEPIFGQVGWNTEMFDYIGLMEDIGQSRPQPDMIFDMMKKLDLPKTILLKTGDTTADVREGKNAGIATAAILTGTQSREAIIAEQPDFLVTSLYELKNIVAGVSQ